MWQGKSRCNLLSEEHGECHHKFHEQYCTVSSFLEHDGSPMYTRRKPSEGGRSGSFEIETKEKMSGL